MPECPECGEVEPEVTEWIYSPRGPGDVSETSLVVCPSCDIVLGGASWAIDG